MSAVKRIGYVLGAFVALLALALGGLFVAYEATLYVPEPGAPREIVIRGGTLFDATSAEPHVSSLVVLRDGVIACIGSACTASDDALEIDATGLAILPGFIDLHRHVFGRRDDPGIFELIWDAARMMPDKRRELLEQGVTSIRQLGDPRDAILERRVLSAAACPRCP